MKASKKVMLVLFILFLIFVFSEKVIEKVSNISLLNIQFESQYSEDLIKKFEDTIEGFTDSSWKSVNYQKTENFYEKRWCKGTNFLDDCVLPVSNIYLREQHLIVLYALHFENEPENFGIGFSSIRVPKNGWGVDFFYNLKGRSIVAEGYNFNFYYFGGGRRKK